MARETRVDVVIPVVGAAAQTRRCVEALYAHVSHRLGTVLVWDNASDAEARETLGALDYPGLEIRHADENSGFGGGSNRAVAAVQSEAVLVMGSDEEVDSDFLSPLCEALDSDPQLALVAPVDRSASATVRRYFDSPVIPTFTFGGAAFLVRRQVFIDSGGFDPEFRLGYACEDLSRRFVRDGWKMGVVPAATLGRVTGARASDRTLYDRRYPAAASNVLLVSGPVVRAAGPVRDAAVDLLSGGGTLQWLGDDPVEGLPAFEVAFRPYSFVGASRALLRGSASRPVTELWLAGRSEVVRAALRSCARRASIPTREFDLRRQSHRVESGRSFNLYRPVRKAVNAGRDWVISRFAPQRVQRSVPLLPEDRQHKRRRWHVLTDLIHEELGDGLVVVELGALNGVTGQHILRYCPSIARLYSIDLEPLRGKQGEPSSDERFRFIQSDSAKAAGPFADHSVDLVFIDADHSEEGTRRDLAAWLPKVREHGIVCGHDYGSHAYPGVKTAVDEAFAARPEQVHLDANKVWWVRKSEP